jgi:hypothetical protein
MWGERQRNVLVRGKSHDVSVYQKSKKHLDCRRRLHGRADHGSGSKREHSPQALTGDGFHYRGQHRAATEQDDPEGWPNVYVLIRNVAFPRGGGTALLSPEHGAEVLRV